MDLADVRAMMDRDLVDRSGLLGYFERIEPMLYRYPAIHALAFRHVGETFAAP